MIPALPWAVTMCCAGEQTPCQQPCGECRATQRRMGHKPIVPRRTPPARTQEGREQ